jgi:hypothetical protein
VTYEIKKNNVEINSLYSFSELVEKLTEKEMLEYHPSFRYKKKYI